MHPNIAPGIKIGTHVSATADEAELRFLRELGIRYVRVHLNADDGSLATLSAVQQRFARAGLEIFSIVYLLYQAPEIAFGLPGRDQILERIAAFIHAMGALGLHTLEYDFFLYAPLPATGISQTRGAETRRFDLGKAVAFPPITDREYSGEDIWRNYSRMMAVLLPAAEKAGVRLALHADDPPVPTLQGVARIFRNIDAFKRGMRTFKSNFWGVLFCVGTWAEGGNAMGMNICEAIRFFANRNKLFTVHFRNVTSPLPCFDETFIDNGYVDMSEIMRTLIEVEFNGLIIPDHFPSFSIEDTGRAALSFAVGYMRGLLDQASAE